MGKKYKLIIFDLDGTLLDTSQGIFNSVRYVEQQMGFAPIPTEILREFVGPPPKTMYMKIYGIDEESAIEATEKHREYGRTQGINEAKIYPGIIELLENLKFCGYVLAVATLKSQRIAENILDNFNLKKYFDVIIGMDLGETFTKCKTIQLAMKQTQISKEVLMIGDSQHDYDGATAAGIDFLGVLYGFGFRADANYDFECVRYPNEIKKKLM